MNDQYVTLFKFLTAEGARALLENQTLRFTPIQDYNDPFEGENVFEFSLDPSTGNVALNDLNGRHRTLDHQPNLEGFYEARECISKHSACCFCGRHDSLLLWSHYAEQHRGVCLEFRFVGYGVGVYEIDDPTDGGQYLFGEVNYSKQRPSILVNTDNASVVPFEMINNSLFTKSLDWAYEEEWRFVMRNSPSVTFRKFAPTCLRRVIFGMRFPVEDEAQIIQIASSKYPHITFGKARKHQFNYAVEVDDLAPHSQ